jgi:hypothetical protein
MGKKKNALSGWFQQFRRESETVSLPEYTDERMQTGHSKQQQPGTGLLFGTG